MSVVHEAICDGCGELEGEVHQTPALAVRAVKAKGWKTVDPIGLLCPACQKK